MPLLNFKAQFVEPIQSGRKHHTIRATRKVPVKRGDLLYLYSGLRQKGAFRILPEPVKCTKVEGIDIIDLGYGIGHLIRTDQGDGLIQLQHDECERLAVADGFDNLACMMKFWEGRLPFVGQIIHWKAGKP
jgi:hypothetical protein